MNPLLFQLQEIDNNLARLKRERSRLDDGSQARGERATLQLAFDAERTHLSSLNSDRTDRELQLKANEEKIARQQSRLMNAKNNHEITALERDIKALNVQRSDSDEAILMLMDEVENSSARLKSWQTQLESKANEVQTIEAAFARDAHVLEGGMDAQRAARAALAAQIDAPSLAKYDDVAKRHGGVAVAHPNAGNCSACGMALTPFNLREAKSQTWPTCESCGRLLHLS